MGGDASRRRDTPGYARCAQWNRDAAWGGTATDGSRRHETKAVGIRIDFCGDGWSSETSPDIRPVRSNGGPYCCAVYTPPAFAVDDRPMILDIIRRASFGHLVTNLDRRGASPELVSTALPFLVDDELLSVRAHFARANDHWRSIDGRSALLIVAINDAYISPRWYPSKAEHGKAVPTWNYELVHLHGSIEIHDGPEWKSALVRDLTDHNERRVSEIDRRPPWEVADAPAEFIDKQLKAIVGVELHVERYEAKQKMSQNRSDGDQRGVVAGLAELVPDDGAVKELPSDGPDPSFRERVGHGCTDRCLEDRDAFGSEDLVERVDELAAPVANEGS